MRLFNDLTKTRLRAIAMGIASTAVIAAAPAFAHTTPNLFSTEQETGAPAAEDEPGDAVDGWDVSGSEDLADEAAPEPGDGAGADEDATHAGGHRHHHASDRVKPSEGTVNPSTNEDAAGDEDQAEQGENDQGEDEDSNEAGNHDQGDNEDEAGDHDSGDEDSEDSGDDEESGDEDSGEHDGDTGGDEGDTGSEDGGESDD
jgi:hypothetical protein